MEAHGTAKRNEQGVTDDEAESSATSVATDPKSDVDDGDDDNVTDEDETESDEDEDEEDEEDDEPRLKYLSLTKNLGSLYRGGDATSYSLVGGDKMVRFA